MCIYIERESKHRSEPWPRCPRYLSPRVPRKGEAWDVPEGPPKGGTRAHTHTHKGYFHADVLPYFPTPSSQQKT